MLLASIILEAKVFLFIMALLTVIFDIIRSVGVIRLKQGKLIPSLSSLVVFGVSLSYILTMLICGF